MLVEGNYLFLNPKILIRVEVKLTQTNDISGLLNAIASAKIGKTLFYSILIT